MRPILGGNVPPARAVGRDAFIRKMWQNLENQSVVLVAERRIGKTTVIRKMAEEPEEGWHPIFMLVEGLRMTELEGPIELRHVPEAVDSLILDPEDTAHFAHYAERIEVYYVYDEPAVELACAILKILCHIDEPMSEAAVRDAVAVEVELTSENLFQKTLALLVKDHYLVRTVRDGDRSYRFKYGIVRRWWLKNRG